MKLCPRICSNCGRRFLGKKMDYRCPICRETAQVTVEVRGNVVTEWRGTRVIGCHAVDHVTTTNLLHPFHLLHLLHLFHLFHLIHL